MCQWPQTLGVFTLGKKLNPYAPPKTELAEPISERQAQPKPAKFAVWLIAASLALGALKLAAVPVPGPAWLGLVILGVLAAFTVAIAKGANWARIVFLILFLIGLPGMSLIKDQLVQEGFVSASIAVVQTLLQLAATVLLFLPVSNAWFRNKPAKAN